VTPAILTVTLNAAVDTTLTVGTLRVGESETARDVLKLPGGKGNNVARTLHRLGIPVIASGLVGGPAASSITDGLTREGVLPRFMHITINTRTCTAIVELDHSRVTEVNEPGAPVAPEVAEHFQHHLDGLLHGADDEVALLVLSGSLPPGLPDDYYARLVRQAREAGVPAVVDSKGKALEAALDEAPLVVKPNKVEAETLLGQRIDAVDDALRAAWALRRRGSQVVALTLGALGAVLVAEKGAWLARAPWQDAVDTVGSGDAFVGGLIDGLWDAVSSGAAASLSTATMDATVLAPALARAAACGAANALTLGAGIIETRDVARIERLVVVEPLGMEPA